jgi:predicted amidophosphoribosyltransferase
MIICPTCGAQSPEGAIFCDECGAALQSSIPQPVNQQPPPIYESQPATVVGVPGTQNCPVCGAPSLPGGLFCENCGASLAPEVSQSPASQFNLPPTVAIPGSKSAGSAITAPGSPSTTEPPPLPSHANHSSLTCKNCGAVLEPDSAFCDMCGSAVEIADQTVHQIPPIPPLPNDSDTSNATVVGGHEAPSEYSQPQVDENIAQQHTAVTQVGEFTSPPSYQQSQTPGYHPQPSSSQQKSGFGTPIIKPGRLVIPDTNVTLPLSARKAEIIVGREDPIGNIFPDIDLTNFGGDECGVSRQHARITLQGNQYYITDLQSTNFTYVNEQRLQPNLATPLHDGDEIRFGNLTMLFYH